MRRNLFFRSIGPQRQFLTRTTAQSRSNQQIQIKQTSNRICPEGLWALQISKTGRCGRATRRSNFFVQGGAKLLWFSLGMRMTLQCVPPFPGGVHLWYSILNTVPICILVYSVSLKCFLHFAVDPDLRWGTGRIFRNVIEWGLVIM